MAARAKKLIARTPRKQHFIDRSAMVASGRASWPINIFLDPYGSRSLEANEKYRGWAGTPSSAESCTLASLERLMAGRLGSFPPRSSAVTPTNFFGIELGKNSAVTL